MNIALISTGMTFSELDRNALLQFGDLEEYTDDEIKRNGLAFCIGNADILIGGHHYLSNEVLNHCHKLGLLLTLVMIFSIQGGVILETPLHIVLIAVPLIIQSFLIFAIAYIACRIWKLPYKIAAPAGMIGASNFFELAVAVAIALFGASSPAALATSVGVLTEVPVMLCLVRIANKTQGWFPAG